MRETKYKEVWEFYVAIKVPSGLMFLVICNPTIKTISYLILSYRYIYNWEFVQVICNSSAVSV